MPHGERLLTYGPFIETKEHLPGFYLVELPDLDTAREAAVRMRQVRFCTAELWPSRAGTPRPFWNERGGAGRDLLAGPPVPERNLKPSAGAKAGGRWPGSCLAVRLHSAACPAARQVPACDNVPCAYAGAAAERAPLTAQN